MFDCTLCYLNLSWYIWCTHILPRVSRSQQGSWINSSSHWSHINTSSWSFKLIMWYMVAQPHRNGMKTTLHDVIVFWNLCNFNEVTKWLNIAVCKASAQVLCSHLNEPQKAVWVILLWTHVKCASICPLKFICATQRISWSAAGVWPNFSVQ